MYAYINGKTTHIEPPTITLEVFGVGYEIYASQSVLDTHKVGDQHATVFIHQDIKETAHTLYGFSSREERELFRTLMSVNGVGTKSALAALSLGFEQLVSAIVGGNSGVLGAVKGLSQKAAEKIILDLQNKIIKKFPNTPTVQINPTTNTQIDDAMFGLMSLGLSRGNALELLNKIDVGNKTAEEIIMLALQKRGK